MHIGNGIKEKDKKIVIPTTLQGFKEFYILYKDSAEKDWFKRITLSIAESYLMSIEVLMLEKYIENFDEKLYIHKCRNLADLKNFWDKYKKTYSEENFLSEASRILHDEDMALLEIYTKK